jgi:hypothetical protein
MARPIPFEYVPLLSDECPSSDARASSESSVVTNPYASIVLPPLEPGQQDKKLLFGERSQPKDHSMEPQQTLYVEPENNATTKTYDPLGNTLGVPTIDRAGHAVRDLSGATLHDLNPAGKLNDRCSACDESNTHPAKRKTTIKWKDVPVTTPHIVAGQNTQTPMAAELEHTTQSISRLTEVNSPPAAATKIQSKEAPSPRPWPGCGTKDLFDIEGLPSDRNPFSVGPLRGNAVDSRNINGSVGKSTYNDWPRDSKIFGDDVGDRSSTLDPQLGSIPIDSGASTNVKYSTRNTWSSLRDPRRMKSPLGFEDSLQQRAKDHASHGAGSPESTLRTYSWSPPFRPRVVSAPTIRYGVALVVFQRLM